MGNISFTNNELGDSAAQGQALGGALFGRGTITFENTKSILFSGNTPGHSPTSAHSNIGRAIYAGANDFSSTNLKTYIPEGEDAITFRGIGGDIIFEDNSAWMAGAIYAYAGTVDGKEGTGGDMTINDVTRDVIFRNNRADAEDKTADWNGNSGAVYSDQDMDIFSVQRNLRFEGIILPQTGPPKLPDTPLNSDAHHACTDAFFISGGPSMEYTVFRRYLHGASNTYKTCGWRGESADTSGWLNSAVFFIPARCITACEGWLTQAVKEYTRSKPSRENPCSRHAFAPSAA